tara:strand:- start:729 stop:986 length:258 start_codon:yes stop_codon:yes gene_type:complete
MAFDYSKLSRIGGMGDAQKVYSYASVDSIATVTGSDYFLPAINELQVNDVIFVSDSDAAAVTVTFVKTNDGSTIDCASGTALGDA